MKSKLNQDAERVAEIFRGEHTTLAELLHLAAASQGRNSLDDARRLFEKALLEYRAEMSGADAIKLARNLIVCTYKDPDLPADTRLAAAERMLQGIFGNPSDGATPLQGAVDSLAESLDKDPAMKQDLFGIAGAVEKRRWDIYGLRMHLVRAYQYYLRGYQMGSANDQGYNGINLAFVLDLLSQQEEGELDQGLAAHEMAVAVRKEIITTLDAQASAAMENEGAKIEENGTGWLWWLLVTLGEAYLGVGKYDLAVLRMQQAAALKAALDKNEDESNRIAPWQLETVARQIVRVARFQAEREKIPTKDLDKAPSWHAVEALLGQNSKAAQSFLHGKIGLALSGGGFRASLFHIGVLAKLAELDILRHVEVLSCVSGGSILGAYYYLELRHLLETHTDDTICRQDYIDLIERVRKGFLAGVQTNIRLQMLFGWKSNRRVLTRKRSSSSDRLGILYETELFARVLDGRAGTPRYLADLRVNPLVSTQDENGKITTGLATTFNPKYDNWGRLNKVPAMVLNATSLNTCHNWQFTASFMGEPPARSIDAEIDANHRMRRMYHWEAPLPYRRPVEGKKRESGVRLGEAVAASACVPGLFYPLLLEDLYGKLGPDKTKYLKQLVDGGVYDNQGVASLREQDCTVLIISDACGQTGIAVEPASDHLGVMMRANDIMMARSREVQYQLLSTLQDSGAIQGLMYLHLKKGLEAQVIDWVDCKDPSTYAKPTPTTAYGVREDVQRLLASVRTDLDSFSWLESDALMLCGYLMADSEWAQCLQDLPTSSEPPVKWAFQKLQAAMTAGREEQGGGTLRNLKKSLHVAQGLAFKPFKLYPILKWAGILVGSFLAAAFIWVIRANWSTPIPSIGKYSSLVLGGILLLVAVREFLLVRILKYRSSYLQIAGAFLMFSVGWILFYPYLKWIDPLYVNWGSDYRKK